MDRRGFFKRSALGPLALQTAAATDVRDFGAIGDGRTDDTDAFQRALNHGGLIWVPAGEYLVGSVVSTRPVGLVGAHRLSVIRLSGTDSREPGVLLRHQGSFIRSIHFHGNQAGRSCVALTGSRCSAHISAEGVTADPGAPVSTSGIVVTGMDCEFSIEAETFLNTGHGNDSTPRVVTVQGRADRYRGSVVRGVGVTSGLVVGAQTGHGRVESIEMYEAEDNGLYLLGGRLTLGRLEYHGKEEALVVKGDLSASTVSVRGEGICAVGLENAGRVWIGRLDVHTVDGQSVGVLWRTRAGNERSTELVIDSVVADVEPIALGSLQNGMVERVAIRDLVARCVFGRRDALPSRFLDFRGVRSIDISNWSVAIVDSGSHHEDRIYQALFATDPGDGRSRWIDVQVMMEVVDEGVPGSFRAVGLANPGRAVRGAEWQTNVGPYVREYGYNGGIQDSANAVPASGMWQKGTALTVVTPSLARVVCVESGRPGVWERL
ncbi:MAG: hypothetical protein HKN72_05480 [Gemmatimonadetes bacterium]|nr:glycoside hydrolase family 55 protein [Gemmatimonadota bacterium]NNF12649.1 hypothetical protein [Gemmatimonadota bacterium]